MGGVVAGACDTGIKPTATIAAPDSADQVLFGMSHYVTDAGIQRAHVRADTAYFYSPAQTAELRNVHITFYDTRGAETSTLTLSRVMIPCDWIGMVTIRNETRRRTSMIGTIRTRPGFFCPTTRPS